MMHRLTCVFLLVVLSSNVLGCPLYTYPLLETCNFPLKMTLTSNPNGIVIDGSNCNQIVPKEEFADTPQIAFPRARSDALYTLVAVDPDAPNYNFGEYWLHWIVTKINGSQFATGDISSGNQIISWVGPAPPENSGAHRYIFLVYLDINPSIPYVVPNERPRFILTHWLERYHGKLCGPFASIQFRSSF